MTAVARESIGATRHPLSRRRLALIARFALASIGFLVVAWGYRLLLLHRDSDIGPSFCALGIVLVLLAWAGTGGLARKRWDGSLPRNDPSPDAAQGPAARPHPPLDPETPVLARLLHQGWWATIDRIGRPRAIIGVTAIGLNLASVLILHTYGYRPTWPLLLWLVSLPLFLIAVPGWRRAAHVHDEPIPGRPRPPLVTPATWRDIAIVMVLLALTLGIRLWRIDDWNTGLHGDEALIGNSAINILRGGSESPFFPGYPAPSVPNFLPWTIAPVIALAGATFAGLKLSMVLVGAILVVPLYALGRMWFGVTTALVASVIYATSAYAIHMSRITLSLIVVPLAITLGLYFLFRGFRSGRLLTFALAGYALALPLYFYWGGRIALVIAAAVVIHRLLEVPLFGPGKPGGDASSKHLRVGPLTYIRDAVRASLESVRAWRVQLAVLALAWTLGALPWIGMAQDPSATGRIGSLNVFSNSASFESDLRDAAHAPLFIVAQTPKWGGISALAPVGLARAGPGLKIMEDGFHARVLASQLGLNLGVFTHLHDGSSFFTLREPAIRAPESVALLIGLGWALLQWRDPRMFALLVWFWSTVLILGVVSVGAPNLMRLSALVPALALLAAVPVVKLASHAIAATRAFDIQRSFDVRILAMGSVALFLVGSAYLNLHSYLVRYYDEPRVGPQLALASYVKALREQPGVIGRTVEWVHMGGPRFDWHNSISRYLLPDEQGWEIGNPADDLPIATQEDRDLIFIIWPWNSEYRDVIRSYYPDGEAHDHLYTPSPGESVWSYRIPGVRRAQQHGVTVRYEGADGSVVENREVAIGTAPRSRVPYPVSAQWSTALVNRTADTRTFRLSGPPGARAILEGQVVLEIGAGEESRAATIRMARGLNPLIVEARLSDERAQVAFVWGTERSAWEPIPTRLLWRGAGGGLTSEYRALSAQNQTVAPQPTRRRDGMFGFRGKPGGAPDERGMMAWTGTLRVDEDGLYEFELRAVAATEVRVSGSPIAFQSIQGRFGQDQRGVAELDAGEHDIQVSHRWNDGHSAIELLMRPPEGNWTIVGGTLLRE